MHCSVQTDIGKTQWSHRGLPRGLSGKEPTCQCRRCGFDPWIEKILWRRKWQPTPLFVPGKSHRKRSLAGYSPWSLKELDVTEHICRFCTLFLFLQQWHKRQCNLFFCPFLYGTVNLEVSMGTYLGILYSSSQYLAQVPGTCSCSVHTY